MFKLSTSMFTGVFFDNFGATEIFFLFRSIFKNGMRMYVAYECVFIALLGTLSFEELQKYWNQRGLCVYSSGLRGFG